MTTRDILLGGVSRLPIYQLLEDMARLRSGIRALIGAAEGQHLEFDGRDIEEMSMPELDALAREISAAHRPAS